MTKYSALVLECSTGYGGPNVELENWGGFWDFLQSLNGLGFDMEADTFI